MTESFLFSWPDLYNLVRCGNPKKSQTISEIGIFGIYLHDNESSSIIENSNEGHLVRTKPANSFVGGVNVGGACIDSLYFSKE